MARRGNASSADIESASLGAWPTQYSYHFWYRNTVEAPNTAAYHHPVQVGSATAINIGFAWSNLDSNFAPAAYHGTALAAYPSAKPTSTLTTNTWYALGASYDGTQLHVWLNGINEASTTADAAQDPITRKICVLGSPAGSFDYGDLAEFGFWSGALLDGEFKALAAGVAPCYVRPASLQVYWPLHGAASPEPDWSGNGLNGTVTGTTVVSHAPVRPLVGGELWVPYVVPVSTQLAVPISDVSTGGWTTAPLYAKLDEAVADDADFISSGVQPSGDVAEVQLTPLTDPGVNTGHRVRIRYRKPS